MTNLVHPFAAVRTLPPDQLAAWLSRVWGGNLVESRKIGLPRPTVVLSRRFEKDVRIVCELSQKNVAFKFQIECWGEHNWEPMLTCGLAGELLIREPDPNWRSTLDEVDPRQWLPFFRRNCFFCGAEIEATMHEQMEWGIAAKEIGLDSFLCQLQLTSVTASP